MVTNHQYPMELPILQWLGTSLQPWLHLMYETKNTWILCKIKSAADILLFLNSLVEIRALTDQARMNQLRTYLTGFSDTIYFMKLYIFMYVTWHVSRKMWLFACFKTKNYDPVIGFERATLHLNILFQHENFISFKQLLSESQPDIDRVFTQKKISYLPNFSVFQTQCKNFPGIFYEWLVELL